MLGCIGTDFLRLHSNLSAVFEICNIIPRLGGEDKARIKQSKEFQRIFLKFHGTCFSNTFRRILKDFSELRAEVLEF